MFCCLLLVLFAAGAQGWEPTRYREIDINGGAVDRDNIIVLTGLSVYRDELVVLDTYGGVITVNVNMQTDNLTVNNSLFDPLVLSHVYTAVDAATGLVAVCTNRRGRCQYMNVSYCSSLCSHRGLSLRETCYVMLLLLLTGVLDK